MWLKYLYVKANPRNRKKPAVVVAGIGRSGTMLMMRSLGANHGLRMDSRHTNASGVMFLNEHKTKHYLRGCLYKTHSFPAMEKLPEHVKVLWLFSNPYDCILSSARKFTGLNHYVNCQSPHADEHDDIFSKDTLLIGEHFRQWYRPQRFAFASIRYESLYERKSLDEISRYLGFELTLLPYRPRASNVQAHPEKETIIRTYRPVYERYLAMEDVKIWPAKA